MKAPRNRNAGSSFVEATGMDSTQDPRRFPRLDQGEGEALSFHLDNNTAEKLD